MEIETGFGINPKQMEKSEVFVVRANDEGEPVLEEKRPTKNGKGVFKQYTLLLKDTDGNDREARYLFPTHMVELAREFGKNTMAWVGKSVLITPKQQGEYWDLELTVTK